MADLLKEMQDIFESCTLEEDSKIRSSVVIDAVTLKYCLNDEVKCALVNKLDPNSLDVTYTKEDLFTVFKDWISGHGSPNDLSPLLLPHSSRFSPPYSSFTSTPIGVALGTKSRFVPFPAPHSQQEYSYETEDVLDFDDTRSSHSSTKKRLTFHKSILESRLKDSEKHANSMEKKYEALNALFEKQKLELERLKQEIKTHREMELCMEEINEQTKKMEKEAEARYSKVQLELCSANSEIELLKTQVTNLNENLVEAERKLSKKESDYLIERQRTERCFETELSKKEGKIQELFKQVKVLERNKADNELSVSLMLDEKLALSNELNDLRERLLILSQSEEIGIPLCDELPSAMLLFPEDSICSSSLPSDTSLNSNRITAPEGLTDLLKDEDKTVTSSEAQTDLPKIEVKIVTSQETQTDLPKIEDQIFTSQEAQTEFPKNKDKFFTSQEAQTDLLKVEDKSFTSQEAQTDLLKIEDNNRIVSNIETSSTCSQTELRIFKSQEAQTNLLKVEDKIFTSRETQSDALTVEDKIFTLQETQTDISWIQREVQTETDVDLPQRFKHFLVILLRFSVSTMTTSLSIVVALFAILIMYLYVCQNNRCVPTLRFPRGLPPV